MTVKSSNSPRSFFSPFVSPSIVIDLKNEKKSIAGLFIHLFERF